MTSLWGPRWDCPEVSSIRGVEWGVATPDAVARPVATLIAQVFRIMAGVL